MKKKDFKSLELKNQERLREIISQKLNTAMDDIFEITGYHPDLTYSILADTIAKSFEIDLSVALLAKPHYANEQKIKHYLKVNPHNVLNKPIFAFRYDHWYEIYNGVHRTECARRRGKKTIKATIITPDKETLKCRELL